jgi:hypothetical protein
MVRLPTRANAVVRLPTWRISTGNGEEWRT